VGREYPAAPVVGVGAVVLTGQRVLLVRRGRPPSQGIWSLPGGVVELGEELKAACAREVAEETGLKVTVGPLVEVLERILRDSKGRVQYHYVLVDFLCAAEEAAPTAGDDAADAKWWDLSDLAQAELTPHTQRVVLKAAGMRDQPGKNP